MQWKLLYGEPKVLQNGAVDCEERVEYIEAADHAEAKSKKDDIIKRGGIVMNAKHYHRIFVKLSVSPTN